MGAVLTQLTEQGEETSNPLPVMTDHNPLVWLNRVVSSNPRLMRWALALQPYNFRIGIGRVKVTKMQIVSQQIGDIDTQGSPRGGDSLVAKVTDAWSACHEFEPSDEEIAERCMLNLSRAQTFSRWCGSLERKSASSEIVLVT
ncbi:hypothetical protein TNCV_3033651 [Trichonephila clavipes]|nr:hypothetical protein TNCV_3033651 [Trichonephila clavipes]